VRVDAEVDVGVVVADEDFGVLGGRLALDRLSLEELGDPDRLAPDLVVEEAVESGNGRDARDDDGRPW
jgi:hypothetical protein